MSANPLLSLRQLGQSIWLDYIQRNMLNNGELARLIADDGLAGVTSNPSIFQQAIAGHDDYRKAVAELVRQGADVREIYHDLVTGDVAGACELFRPLYDASAGRDGYVSIEVSPHLAHDTQGTVAEARELWSCLARPNVMIKVPATRAGVDAVRTLVAHGVNVNATLLFGATRYREVADAWLAGLEDRAAAGRTLAHCASVASFFLSRIDTLVDRRLDAIGHATAVRKAYELRGMAAIASARLAYQEYRRMIGSERWRALARHGAMPQRLLWASTGTKDGTYSDVKYVEAVIGRETVNTLTPQTLEAYRDHGVPQARLESDIDLARALPDALAGLGIDLERVARELEDEGVQKFIDAYDALLSTIAQWRSRQTEAASAEIH